MWNIKLLTLLSQSVHSLSCPTVCDPMDCSMSGLCPSPTPKACSHSCSLSRWCHPAILSFVIPFSSCLQFFQTSGSFLMSQLFASGGLSTKASASVLPMNIQGWFPLGLTGWIYLQSRGFSRVFSHTTVQKLQPFSAQPSLWSLSYHLAAASPLPLDVGYLFLVDPAFSCWWLLSS